MIWYANCNRRGWLVVIKIYGETGNEQQHQERRRPAAEIIRGQRIEEMPSKRSKGRKQRYKIRNNSKRERKG